jgi:hypothetical protein
MLTDSDIARFWTRVSRGSDEDCWLWTGCYMPYGYGAFWLGANNIGAHRVAWMIANKTDIPDGMLICHHCDNPPCVNPKHLFLGTRGDNWRDCIAKNRCPQLKRLHPPIESIPRGEQHWNAKLTSDSVREIRRLASGGLSHHKIAKMFTVSGSNVSLIVQGLRWAWVK